ncbi:MAG: DNA polymerase III subunit delta' [Anaerolineae bacterium]|nr:DNA polymerase III subunit delta' [Anaerolineae bacterium]
MWSVVGHEWAVELLSRSIASEQISHAYLLTGLSRIGKTTLARALAQALNCQRADSKAPPCGICRSCQLARTNKHPDIQVIEPVQNHIRIEVLRALQNTAALSPVEGRYRVFVISQIDAATPSAVNCLLKTLEEPPARVIMVLTADRVEAVLPTIVSRCQVINLRPLPVGQVTQDLVERGVDPSQARLLGRLSQGRIGWAFAAADSPQFLEQRDRILDKLIDLNAATYTARFDYAEQLSKKAEQVPQILEILGSWWHDVLMLAAGSMTPVTNIDRQAQLEQWAARVSVQAATAMLRSVNQTAWQVDHNANLRLALEVLMLDMPTLTRSA